MLYCFRVVLYLPCFYLIFSFLLVWNYVLFIQKCWFAGSVWLCWSIDLKLKYIVCVLYFCFVNFFLPLTFSFLIFETIFDLVFWNNYCQMYKVEFLKDVFSFSDVHFLVLSLLTENTKFWFYSSSWWYLYCNYWLVPHSLSFIPLLRERSTYWVIY